MFTRELELPKRSFFLFGPRSTGKTTWLRSRLGDARWYNLLLDRELVRLIRDPVVFRQEIDAVPPGSWVVIDEVQRLPSLLNEIHDVLASHPGRLRFAITGSSARKLRRKDVDLLAGRIITRQFFPLTASEMDFEFEVDDLLRFGALPLVRSEPDPTTRIDLLEAYADTYLTQEIRAEALVRDLDSFSRFLEIAALSSGQVTNIAGIARNAGVARPTVQGYFDVLVDTLVGVWLRPHRVRARVKEIAHPKFYFFDAGVTRSLGRRLREPLEQAERGPLLETLVLHELRAFQNAAGCGGELSYWRTPSGSEVDFIWRRGARAVGIEVKASTRWRSEHSRTLQELLAARIVHRGVAVYLGDRRLRDNGIDVFPLADYLRELASGRIIG